MTEIERFKAWAQPAPERQLMTVGSDELPEPMAMQRVAQRLGVSAAALAAASATTLVAPPAIAATLVKSQGLFSATLVKGLVLGLGLGMSVVVGTAIVRAPSPHVMPGPSRSTATQRVSVAAIPVGAEVLAAPSEMDGVAAASSVVAASSVATVSHVTAASRVAVARVADPNAVAGRIGTRESDAPSDEELARASQAPLHDTTRTHATRADATRATDSVQRRRSDASPLSSSKPATLDPRLAREIASLDQVRSIWQKGDAAQALLVLRNFERREGFLALQREALLTSIELLLALGERSQAAAVARRLLQAGVSSSERPRLEAIVSGAAR
ncbi:MAG TPA: hypothetical protein VIV60_26410 [Polyangiaceae bacterium]